jgi:hypothetical protein
MALRRRTRTFKVWLVDRAEIGRAYYKSAALPAVGETILVRKMKLDAKGSWRKTRTEPVPVRVTRVGAGFITVATY